MLHDFHYTSAPEARRESVEMQIAVAAYGWQGPQWGPFYPAGLPAEWRLAYYANEFFAVVVPYREWSAAGDETLLAWSREVRAEFCFYWELPRRESAARARLQRLREDRSESVV